MAEMAVSLVVDQLLPLLREEAKLLRGVHKEFAEIKDELESIQAFLKDADKRAAGAEGDNTGEGVKIWVKQLREAAFRIEDIIDDYLIQVGQQPRDPGCIDLLHKLKTMIPRRRIASEIQDLKTSVRGITERSERYGFQRSFEQGTSNSRGSRNAKWHDPRVAALYVEEAEVVGFEAPRQRLIEWMVKGREERTVLSVVGMGGQGKTTLAKKVFDSKDIIGHFDCRVWITVSQSYEVEGLLRDMLLKIYKQEGDNSPPSIYQMDRELLTDEVRKYLQKKRLKEFPEWMLALQNLTVLRLVCPYLVKDPLQSLKSLQHLLSLFLELRKYVDSHLHFQGGFQKLKKLEVILCIELREIIIDKGSMPSLKTLWLKDLPNLKNIPTGIQNLEKLEELYISGVDDEFGERSSTEDWNWIMELKFILKILTKLKSQGLRNDALSYCR